MEIKELAQSEGGESSQITKPIYLNCIKASQLKFSMFISISSAVLLLK